jgi:polyhydroxyalkanoate synthesis regulator phasin
MGKANRQRPSRRGASEPLERLRDNMRRLQRDAEQLLNRTRKQATNLISRDQKKALNALLTQAGKVRADFEKRAQQAQKQVEAQADKLLGRVEKQLADRLRPLLRRLNLPTKSEVQALQKRIAELEARLKASASQAARAGGQTTEVEPHP